MQYTKVVWIQKFLNKEFMTPASSSNFAKKHRRLFSKTAYLQSPAPAASPPNAFYTEQLLHQRTVRTKIFDTIQPLHQPTFPPPPFTPDTCYTKQFLHQPPFPPDTFYSKHPLRQPPFTPDTFCARNLSHQTAFTPTVFYTRHLLHQRVFSPNTFLRCNLYTWHLLQQTTFTPETFCTQHLLHQTPFTQTDFTPGTSYTRRLLHQTPQHVKLSGSVCSTLYWDKTRSYMVCKTDCVLHASQQPESFEEGPPDPQVRRTKLSGLSGPAFGLL